LFRGINIDKLADSVRTSNGEYRVNTDIERYFIDILSNVKIDVKRKAFICSVPEIYEAACDEAERKASFLKEEVPFADLVAMVKIVEVRRWLRTSHDQTRFDQWLRAVTKYVNSYVVA